MLVAAANFEQSRIFPTKGQSACYLFASQKVVGWGGNSRWQGQQQPHNRCNRPEMERMELAEGNLTEGTHHVSNTADRFPGNPAFKAVRRRRILRNHSIPCGEENSLNVGMSEKLG